MNEYGLAFFGYSSEELIGQQIMTIIPEVEKSTGRDLTKLVGDIAKDPDQYKLVTNENITKNGRTVWVAWTNKGLFNKQGNVEEILAIGNDLTESKQYEELLVKQKYYLEKAHKHQA